MRILVFGGSFDPPHRGHAALLSAAAETIRPDRILIVPAWRAPLKDAPAEPAGLRAELCRVGLLDRLRRRWRRRARIDLSEVSAKRRVFTVETLARLRRVHPHAELHFVCGRDSAERFHSWKSPGALRRSATWWYGGRPGSNGAVPSFFRRVPGRFPAISSRDARVRLALGEDCDGELFADVLARIERAGAYGRGRLSVLRATLKPGRYEHTLCVARLADALARRHDVDPVRALTAGLLHDAGRRFSPPEMATYARRRRLPIPRREETSAMEPILLHAHISADLAAREFGVRDPGVLAAISKHTLGARRMSLLDRVLYVADACSADRTHSGVAKTRALAFEDLDAALAACVAKKISSAVARGSWLHPATMELWNSLAAR